MKLWTKFFNEANYIDTPYVYYSDEFWPRFKKGTTPISKKTDIRMKMWKRLYKEFGIKNNNYCNPELNYLVCINRKDKINIFDILKDRKIMCITTRNEIIEILKPKCKSVGMEFLNLEQASIYDNKIMVECYNEGTDKILRYSLK